MLLDVEEVAADVGQAIAVVDVGGQLGHLDTWRIGEQGNEIVDGRPLCVAPPAQFGEVVPQRLLDISSCLQGGRRRVCGADIAEPNRRGPKALADLVKSEVARLTPILKAAAR